jgi:hypothetical protein
VVRESAPEPPTQTEIAVSVYSNAEKEAFTNQSPVVIEGARIDEGGTAAVPNMRKSAGPEPKLINPPARADRLPAVVSENKPEPATQTEIAVSANSNAEKGAFTAHDGVVIEETRIDRDGPASARPATEKEHSDIEHVKVEFFAKQVPATVDELVEDLEAFSALCEQVMMSNARSKSRIRAECNFGLNRRGPSQRASRHAQVERVLRHWSGSFGI